MSRLARFRRRWRSHRLQARIARAQEVVGVFLPYRHAQDLRPTGAPELLPIFEAAEPAMRELLTTIEGFADAFARFGGPAPAPRFEQDWFPGLDALAAYALVRSRAPRQIVEIGSGHSTRIMARAMADGGLATRITAIDPAPRAALRDLPVTWHAQLLQASDPALVDRLAPGDILFVDSSHLLVAGSDVEWVLTRLLPRVRPGVLLHVHDVFLPDPYPPNWAWRGYNEQAALVPLLLGGWRLLWTSHYLRTHRPQLLQDNLAAHVPPPEGAFESSLWLERTPACVPPHRSGNPGSGRKAKRRLGAS
ncbi:MAG: class I SAM-dependent methyltransferase [Geminicoccaceae bacterium]|nr:MAG: class I SAM-dependent methyltransferase [Geminicoccaceae bacterium]